jgi:hypothetical protein
VRIDFSVGEFGVTENRLKFAVISEK